MTEKEFSRVGQRMALQRLEGYDNLFETDIYDVCRNEDGTLFVAIETHMEFNFTDEQMEVWLKHNKDLMKESEWA